MRSNHSKLILLLLLIAMFISNGCYIHSDEQEQLAKDIQTRYGAVLPAGTEVLESLDKDVERLLASKRADFELLKETSAIELVDLNWDEVIRRTDALNSRLFSASVKAQKGKREGTEIKNALQKKIADFDDKLQVINKAIGRIEDTKTLQERLNESREIIREVTSAIHTLMPAPGASPIDNRLSQALGEINQYLGSIKSERDKTEQTFSLILEALRLGRDVTSLEQEALQQELSFHERRLSLFIAEERLAKQIADVPDMLAIFVKYNKREGIQDRIEILAHEAEAGNKRSAQDLRDILERLGGLQTLKITTEGHIKEIDLRLEVERYRNARLLDAIFERQRMSLISYGLQGVVRYAQGGLRAQDITRITNIAQMIAQIVIAVRVGR